MSKAEFMLSMGPFNFELPDIFFKSPENGDVPRGVKPKSRGSSTGFPDFRATRIDDMFLTSVPVPLPLLIVGKDACDPSLQPPSTARSPSLLITVLRFSCHRLRPSLAIWSQQP